MSETVMNEIPLPTVCEMMALLEKFLAASHARLQRGERLRTHEILLEIGALDQKRSAGLVGVARGVIDAVEDCYSSDQRITIRVNRRELETLIACLQGSAPASHLLPRLTAMGEGWIAP